MQISITKDLSNGTVFGVVLNDHASLDKMGEALSQEPYLAPPKAPILYIKPKNTIVESGAIVQLPSGASQVEIGATIGIVIGKNSSRLSIENAQAAIFGFVVVCDLSLPHAAYYRPAIREKCFDGACPIGRIVTAHDMNDLNSIVLKTYIDDVLVAEHPLSDMVRDTPRLLVDVTEFMTLSAGDVLLTGVPYRAPQASARSKIKITAAQLGSVEFSVNGSQEEKAT